MSEPAGPASYGEGDWPRMTFGHLDDAGQQAACEFVQEVVAAVVQALTPTEDPTRVVLSRRQLAKELELSHDTVLDILNGVRWPRTDRLIRIAHKVGVIAGVLD